MPAWLNLMGQLLFEQESLALAMPQSQARFEREQAFQLQRIKQMSDDKQRLVVQKLHLFNLAFDLCRIIPTLIRQKR